jgi:hypothetical protein
MLQMSKCVKKTEKKRKTVGLKNLKKNLLNRQICKF